MTQRHFGRCRSLLSLSCGGPAVRK